MSPQSVLNPREIFSDKPAPDGLTTDELGIDCGNYYARIRKISPRSPFSITASRFTSRTVMWGPLLEPICQRQHLIQHACIRSFTSDSAKMVRCQVQSRATQRHSYSLRRLCYGLYRAENSHRKPHCYSSIIFNLPISRYTVLSFIHNLHIKLRKCINVCIPSI